MLSEPQGKSHAGVGEPMLDWMKIWGTRDVTARVVTPRVCSAYIEARLLIWCTPYRPLLFHSVCMSLTIKFSVIRYLLVLILFDEQPFRFSLRSYIIRNVFDNQLINASSR